MSSPRKIRRTNLLVLFSMLLYASNYTVCRIYFINGGEVAQFIIYRSIISLFIAYCLIVQYKKQVSRSRAIFDYINECIEGENEETGTDCEFTDESNSDASGGIRSPEIRFPILLPTDNLAIYIASIAGAFRQLIMQIALKYTHARNAGIIQPSVPVATAILGQWLGIEKVSVVTYISIIISIVGLFVSLDLSIDNAGGLMLLSVPIVKAAQIICLKLAANRLDKSLVQIYQILILVGASLPVAFIYQFLFGSVFSLFYITFTQALCIIYSAISIVYIAWKIQIVGVRIIGPTRVSLYQVVQPIFTIFLEYIFLGEEITTRIFIGTVIVIVALIIQIFANEQNEDERANLSPVDLDDQLDLSDDNYEMRTRLLENI